MTFLVVFLGGGAGALSRYLMSLWVGSLWDGSFPLGTFLINLIGCFLIGFLGGLSERLTIEPNVRLLLQTGFLGGFTTFSSFGLESFQLLRKGEGWVASGYVLGSNLIGIVLVVAGFFASKAILASLDRTK
jgi:CrcB protein